MTQMKEKNYYVYIITNKHNTVLYVGVTNNLVRWVYQHREKIVEGFSKKYNVTKLVHYEIAYDPQSAIEREKKIKAKRSQKKIELIEKMNPEWKDLWNNIASYRGHSFNQRGVVLDGDSHVVALRATPQNDKIGWSLDWSLLLDIPLPWWWELRFGKASGEGETRNHPHLYPLPDGGTLPRQGGGRRSKGRPFGWPFNLCNLRIKFPSPYEMRMPLWESGRGEGEKKIPQPNLLPDMAYVPEGEGPILINYQFLIDAVFFSISPLTGEN